MRNFINLIVAALLVPCLIADPVAGAFQSGSVSPVIQRQTGLNPAGRFQEQALEERVLWMRRVVDDVRSVPRIHAIAAAAALIMGTAEVYSSASPQTVIQGALWIASGGAFAWMGLLGVQFVPGALMAEAPQPTYAEIRFYELIESSLQSVRRRFQRQIAVLEKKVKTSAMNFSSSDLSALDLFRISIGEGLYYLARLARTGLIKTSSLTIEQLAIQSFHSTPLSEGGFALKALAAVEANSASQLTQIWLDEISALIPERLEEIQAIRAESPPAPSKDEDQDILDEIEAVGLKADLFAPGTLEESSLLAYSRLEAARREALEILAGLNAKGVIDGVNPDLYSDDPHKEQWAIEMAGSSGNTEFLPDLRNLFTKHKRKLQKLLELPRGAGAVALIISRELARERMTLRMLARALAQLGDGANGSLYLRSDLIENGLASRSYLDRYAQAAALVDLDGPESVLYLLTAQFESSGRPVQENDRFLEQDAADQLALAILRWRPINRASINLVQYLLEPAAGRLKPQEGSGRESDAQQLKSIIRKEMTRRLSANTEGLFGRWVVLYRSAALLAVLGDQSGIEFLHPHLFMRSMRSSDETYAYFSTVRSVLQTLDVPEPLERPHPVREPGGFWRILSLLFGLGITGALIQAVLNAANGAAFPGATPSNLLLAGMTSGIPGTVAVMAVILLALVTVAWDLMLQSEFLERSGKTGAYSVFTGKMHLFLTMGLFIITGEINQYLFEAGVGLGLNDNPVLPHWLQSLWVPFQIVQLPLLLIGIVGLLRRNPVYSMHQGLRKVLTVHAAALFIFSGVAGILPWADPLYRFDGHDFVAIWMAGLNSLLFHWIFWRRVDAGSTVIPGDNPGDGGLRNNPSSHVLRVAA